MTTTLSPLPVGTKSLTLDMVRGRILAWREQNGYHDSYFHSLIAFDAPDGGYVFGWRETGATAYAGGFIGRPDCTDEGILAAYQVRRDEVMADQAERAAQDALREVTVGKTVTVIDPPSRGKNKVPMGTTGAVKRKVENAYGDPYGAKYGRPKRYRVEVETEHGTVWLDEERVRVSGYESDPLPLRDSAVEYMVAQSWPARVGAQ